MQWRVALSAAKAFTRTCAPDGRESLVGDDGEINDGVVIGRIQS
jgi:hypothetical protein